jgi:hypothetical protein
MYPRRRAKRRIPPSGTSAFATVFGARPFVVSVAARLAISAGVSERIRLRPTSGSRWWSR